MWHTSAPGRQTKNGLRSRVKLMPGRYPGWVMNDGDPVAAVRQDPRVLVLFQVPVECCFDEGVKNHAVRFQQRLKGSQSIGPTAAMMGKGQMAGQSQLRLWRSSLSCRLFHHGNTGIIASGSGALSLLPFTVGRLDSSRIG